MASHRLALVTQWLDFSFGFRVGGRLIRHRFIRSEKKYIKVRFTYLSLERSNVRHVPYIFTSALTLLNHMLEDLLLLRLEQPWLRVLNVFLLPLNDSQ